MDSVADHPDGWGFPIRISPDQSVLATPRSFSQPTTSFIASQCQGIRQTPLLCLISRLSAKRRSCDRLYGSFRAGDDPRHDNGLVYPFLPLRLGDGARNLDFRPLPINDVKEQAGALRRYSASSDGGGRRDRTDDLLLAKQALSQLSYAPVER